jgi:ATP-binding cassette subfamily C protein
MSGEIKVADLHFQYGESRPIFEGVTLQIVEGSLTALIGKSGAGKTTLLNLVMGFLTPSHGEVTIDGLPSSAYVARNPGRVSYVPQRPHLIDGTVAENIALGVEASKIDGKRVAKTLEECGLKEWVETLPHGAETLLKEDEVSGGQIQRIGIARALYTEPKYLFLDEPTSALDKETETHIVNTLNRLRGICTIVVIAHRESTIKSADVTVRVSNRTVTSF